MGGNGSFLKRAADSESERRYFTVDTLGEIQIIQYKNGKQRKMPEESHTPNRIYATFEKDGSDVKAIARYGSDGKKIFEIHTVDHYGIHPHYHLWGDGTQQKDGFPLTSEMKMLLDKVRKYDKGKYKDMKREDNVVGYDLAGYPYNKKYPPNEDKFGNRYGGYGSWNKWILFYDFAVQGYD